MRPKKVILCVDDNEQELSVLKFTLQINAYSVLSASNGQEAVRIFSSTPQVDLVLADANLPQMSGGQLVERLKRMAGHVPMVLLTDAQPGAPSGSGELHVADALVVRRNYSTLELLELVKRMSARKRGPRKAAQRVTHEEELAAVS